MSGMSFTSYRECCDCCKCETLRYWDNEGAKEQSVSRMINALREIRRVKLLTGREAINHQVKLYIRNKRNAKT